MLIWLQFCGWKRTVMDSKIDKLKKVRHFILAQIEDLNENQLNKVPEGFNNNIAWNLAHLICAQQALCYLRAGLEPKLSMDFYTPFSTNTKPDRFLSLPEIQKIKADFKESIDFLNEDYSGSSYGAYTPSPNILRVYDIEIQSIDEAIEFLLYHEGYHTGTILALTKLVK